MPAEQSSPTHASEPHHLTFGFSIGLNYSQGSSSLVWVTPRACPIPTDTRLGQRQTQVPPVRLAEVQGSTSSSSSPDGPQTRSVFILPPPHLRSSTQLCQAMGLGKGEQVGRWGNQGLAWCEVSLRVSPSPLIKQNAFTRIGQTPPHSSSKPLLAFLLGGGSSQEIQELLGGTVQRIWQVGPKGQGRGNDVRKVEGIRTEHCQQPALLCCLRLSGPPPSDLQCQPAQPGKCLWGNAQPRSPVSQRPARELTADRRPGN